MAFRAWARRRFQLLPDDLDLSFIAGDALAELAKFRHVVFQALETLVHGVKALVHVLVLGVETLVDVLVLRIEALAHVGLEVVETLALSVETLVLGVEALVDGTEDSKLGNSGKCGEDAADCCQGPCVLFSPAPYLLHRASKAVGLGGLYHGFRNSGSVVPDMSDLGRGKGGKDHCNRRVVFEA